jgi:hypothetical protein
MTISKVLYELDTEGLSAGASSASGTLTIVAASSDKSIQGFISGTRSVFSSPPADEILGDLDAENNLALTFSSLQTNKTYYLKLRSYPLPGQDGQASPYKYFSFKVPQITDDVISQSQSSEENKQEQEEGPTSTALAKDVLISRSLLKISTDKDKPNTISCAVKNTGIDVAGGVPAYYAFGTTLFFEPKSTNSKQSGGIGFFVSGSSNTGYFISIKTSESASSAGDEFKILKVKGDVIKKLPDNQVFSTGKSVGQQVGVLSGVSYKIDVKVRVTANKVNIKAYVNGFQVTAEDVNSGSEKILNRTPSISLFSSLGTIFFDYAYAMPITESTYNIAGMDTIYNKQMSVATIDMAYGDVFIDDIATVNSQTTNKYIEEFGPVAREIRYVKKRYERTPSYPKFTFQNLNKGVNILASKLSSFDAEVYLINNSGVSNALTSESGTQISVVGNNLVKSDEIIFTDEDNDKFGVQEPISFESSWIQKIADAKNLSDFIKSQWSKNQKVVKIVSFGNPMISVSDIISIKYDYHGLAGTEKFLVTDVQQSWTEGLETTITARSIFS